MRMIPNVVCKLFLARFANNQQVRIILARIFHYSNYSVEEQSLFNGD